MKRTTQLALAFWFAFCVYTMNRPAFAGQTEERTTMTSREELRDRHGNLIGIIEINGSRRTLRDKAGNRLGEYSSGDNWTRDKQGNPVGQGDLLTTLLR
jgi:hypothetical protein